MSTVPSGPEPPETPQRPRKVVLYHAPECHLCAAARRVLESVRAEQPFELEEIDISGDAELEYRYRGFLPVIEIDGAHAFTYFVQPDALRRKLAQAGSGNGTL
jgi:glutaredoxin